MTEIPTISITTIRQFHNWLQKNYNKQTKVHVLLHKRHTGKPAPTHKELMDEAICHGWIDTTVKRIDENIYRRAFVKRTPKGKWSNNTQRYARELIKAGQMQPEGRKAFELGLKIKVHDHGIPRNPRLQSAVKNALQSKGLLKAYKSLPPSKRKMYQIWYSIAKRQETKDKRIKEILRVAKGRKNKVVRK